MTDFYTIWLLVMHYGYGVVAEFVIDLGDQFVIHFIVVVILKAGAISGVVAVARHIHIRRQRKPTE